MKKFGVSFRLTDDEYGDAIHLFDSLDDVHNFLREEAENLSCDDEDNEHLENVLYTVYRLHDSENFYGVKDEGTLLDFSDAD